MQTVATDQSSWNYNKSMDLMDSMNMKNVIVETNNCSQSKKCSLCDYATSYTGSLKTHMKTHTGEKSNKCNQCDYASSRAGHLKTHMKKHTGEKSNKCNQCDYTSSQAGHLKTHMKKTHWRIVKQ